MEFRYQNGLMEACQWLSLASHVLFEMSVEIALCDDKKENNTPPLSLSDLKMLDGLGMKQNPYVTELNQLAEKLRDKLELLIEINNLDTFEIESWHLLPIFDDDAPEKKLKLSYHKLVLFAYRQIAFFPAKVMSIVLPGVQMLLTHTMDTTPYSKDERLYERSFRLLIDAADDFDTASQGFIIARYLAKIEGRIV
ncbi:hypothetical protein [Arcticibacter sp. MXS-1]|uniref:hypothetical protein n=1 Tax=Arcticibacter sp. MXS-1 TaxID=3341726 RepID=UPI0035A98D55